MKEDLKKRFKKKNRYTTAWVDGERESTEKLLDLLSASVGFRCSFATMGEKNWQVMTEMGQSLKGDAEKYFKWYLVKYAENQWHSTTLEAAHAFLMGWLDWKSKGEPEPWPGWSTL